LIGATTENPSFTINNALLSRVRVFVFKSIIPEEIADFFLQNKSRILKELPKITDITTETFSLIGKISDGDLRNAISILESASILKESGVLTPDDIPAIFNKPLYYDRDTEEHYNIISAMHKSLRDSDGDAAIYWIGRMLAGGEDPLYIARRLLNFAAEDV
jgi:putative ATPase